MISTIELSEKEKDRLIRRIIRNFDFQKVNKVMIATDWKWMGKRPKIHEMKKKAEHLLSMLLNHPNNYTSFSTGGFTAFRDGDNIGLNFTVTEFSVSLNADDDL